MFCCLERNGMMSVLKSATKISVGDKNVLSYGSYTITLIQQTFTDCAETGASMQPLESQRLFSPQNLSPMDLNLFQSVDITTLSMSLFLILKKQEYYVFLDIFLKKKRHAID